MKYLPGFYNEKGSALLVALIFLGVLTMLGVSVTLTSTTQLKIAANTEETNRIFHSTNAGANAALGETSVAGKTVGDALLSMQAQSGSKNEVSFLTELYEKVKGTGKKFDHELTVSIEQDAKGVLCPRSEQPSSVTKIACDYFEISSTYQPDNAGSSCGTDSEYNPAVKIGVYREMIYVNSATNNGIDFTGSGS